MVERTREASGPRGARWTVDPGSAIRGRVAETLSQADPRPPGTGAALREVLANDLNDRIGAGAHDAFAGRGGLGIEAGSLYGRITESGSTIVALGSGGDLVKAKTLLERLAGAGLVVGDGLQWHRTDSSELDRIAVEQGTDGRGAERAARYARERAAWAWWRAELSWMRSPRGRPERSGAPRVREVAKSRTGLPHPRRRDGRAHFALARRLLDFGFAFPDFLDRPGAGGKLPDHRMTSANADVPILTMPRQSREEGPVGGAARQHSLTP